MAAVSGCGTPRTEIAQSSSAVFVNGDFESGAAGVVPPAPWALLTFLNSSGVTITTPQTRAGLNLAAGGNALTTTVNGANQPDPDLGAAASLRWPRYGSQCARINFHSSSTYGNGKNVNSLSQTMTIGGGDVDPADGQIHVRFVAAAVLQNPGHPANQQPYYFIQLTNITKGTILYTDFNLSAQVGVPWKTVNGGTANEIDYTDWQLVDIAPGSARLAMGDQVKLEVIGGGCSPGGHFGEVYLDGVGSTIPGLFVSGSGPAQANPGANITYTINYKNGSASAESTVVIDFTTPPNTTFQSLTPLAGATCVPPAVGTAGTITCTFTNPVAAAAAGSFTVTVNINAAASGQIVCGTYDIHSAQETALLGNKIITNLGCNLDSDCAAGNWCNETAHLCTPTLANGIAIPTDGPHSGPTLNGTCTVAAGTLVCTSSVCDTADSKCGYANSDGPCSAVNGGVVCRSAVCDPDNKCGYANGDGPCTVGTAGVVCRAAVCDPDGKCGYAVGDGPCTAGNAGTVCRSGACSTNGKCEPPGGCNVDADCAGGNWCDETIHTCTPKLPNGTAMPTDGPHTSPTLNGTCTAPAATLVCVSAVCDTADNKCGYAIGDGPCTAGNGGVVCRSGACSSNGKCEPAGGCNVDADCAGGNWCDETIHTCTPKLPNGTALPTDGPHTSPTLNGMCTAPAATLVCVSAVCDTADNKCGYAVGDGPCTAGNGGVVCRSGACSTNGLCEPAGGCNVDADCAAGHWCNETAHACTPTLPNGTAMPTDGPHTSPTLNGTCTAPAATLVCTSKVCDTADSKCGLVNGDGPCTAGNGGVVCRSGVCDPDDKCGYAVGDGPCTAGNAGTVCRSGACSANGLCEPAGGCNVDADCSGGTWCHESMHACGPKLVNGTALPMDAPHANPTLDGSCTAAAATLVCESGVCDAHDNECGLADGDGPCTAANGDVVCRTGRCKTDGTCGADAGCGSNADCLDPTSPICDVSSGVCGPASTSPPDGGVSGRGVAFAGGGFCAIATTRAAADESLLVLGIVCLFLLALRRRSACA